MLVIKIFSRSFVVSQKENEEKYKNFIVKEIDKKLQEKDTIDVNGVKLSGNSIDNVNIKLQLIKIVKRKLITFKKNRRKRYCLRKNYKQLVGYFSVLEVNNDC